MTQYDDVQIHVAIDTIQLKAVQYWPMGSPTLERVNHLCRDLRMMFVQASMDSPLENNPPIPTDSPVECRLSNS